MSDNRRSNWVAAKAEFDRLEGEYQRGATLLVNRRFKRLLGRTSGDLWGGDPIVELALWALDELDEAEVIDTVRHEYAHVLSGPGHGHDDVWRDNCKLVGATPKARAKGVTSPAGRRKPKWVVYCPSCGTDIGRRKIRKPNLVHSRCGSDVAYKPVAAA